MNFLAAVDKIANNPLTKATIFAWDKYKKNKVKMLREIIRAEIR